MKTEKPSFEGCSVAFTNMLDTLARVRHIPNCLDQDGKYLFKNPSSSQDRPVHAKTVANAVDRLTEGFSSNPAARHRSGRNNPETTPKSSQNLYRGGWADGRDRAPPKAANHRERCGNPERASDTDDFQCSIIKGCIHRPLLPEFNAAGSAWWRYRWIDRQTNH